MDQKQKKHIDFYVFIFFVLAVLIAFLGLSGYIYITNAKYRLTKSDMCKVKSLYEKRNEEIRREERTNGKSDKKLHEILTNEELSKVKEECNKSEIIGPALYDKFIRIYERLPLFYDNVFEYYLIAQTENGKLLLIFATKTLLKEEFRFESYESDLMKHPDYEEIEGDEATRKKEMKEAFRKNLDEDIEGIYSKKKWD